MRRTLFWFFLFGLVIPCFSQSNLVYGSWILNSRDYDAKANVTILTIIEREFLPDGSAHRIFQSQEIGKGNWLDFSGAYTEYRQPKILQTEEYTAKFKLTEFNSITGKIVLIRNDTKETFDATYTLMSNGNRLRLDFSEGEWYVFVRKGISLNELSGGNSVPNPGLASSSVIESRIDGEFTGWEGETVFVLQNGQVWKQAEYKYMYHYAYSPKVTIVGGAFTSTMTVEGVSTSLKVQRVR